MSEEQIAPDYQQNDRRFLSVLQELIHIKETHAVEQLRFFKVRAPRARRSFRLASALIIILSVSIPFSSTLEGAWKTIALPIAALLIAGLTGLSAFFHWESNWKGYTQTQLTLEYMLGVWELRITEAKHELDPQKAIAMALQATEELLSNTNMTMTTATEEYFQRVKAPKSIKINHAVQGKMKKVKLVYALYKTSVQKNTYTDDLDPLYTLPLHINHDAQQQNDEFNRHFSTGWFFLRPSLKCWFLECKFMNMVDFSWRLFFSYEKRVIRCPGRYAHR